MNEGGGRGSGVAMVDGGDGRRREKVAILLTNGRICIRGRNRRTVGRRIGSGVEKTWPRQRRRSGAGRRR